jgi:hypothetical protein
MASENLESNGFPDAIIYEIRVENQFANSANDGRRPVTLVCS